MDGDTTIRTETVPRGSAVTHYVDPAMYEAPAMRSMEPKAVLLQAPTDPLVHVAQAARLYSGILPDPDGNISVDEQVRVWYDMTRTQLGAPLEFVNVHFYVEGVTRALTHQMVRQRTAVYVQESLRFSTKHELPVAMPPSIAMLPDNDERRVRWEWFMANTEEEYNFMVANGIPAEDARALLPHATLTRIHYATNLRNLITEFGKRTCTQAQFEWRQLLMSMAKALSDHGQAWKDLIVPYMLRPPCFAAGHCTLNASFDRSCTIRDRVQAGKFVDIKPQEYLLDPTAAR